MSIPLHLKRTQAGIVVKVHPVVPLIACDAYIRRGSTNRVIGTIVGTTVDNEYHVTNCFVVPHTETTSQVSIDIHHHQTLFELHQKVYPKESILGWFSSCHTLQGVDSLVQDFYTDLVPFPIHLAIDASLQNTEEVKITAQVSRAIYLKKVHVATEFVDVECHVDMKHAESLGLDLLQNGLTEELPKAPENLTSTLKNLIQLVDDAYDYVSKVVDGSQKGDSAIGRYLSDTLSVVPFLDRNKFGSLFRDRLQELFLVLYLANLAKSQIAIADKLVSKTL